MAYKFNPLIGIGLDDVGEGGAGGTPGGSDTQVQFNDGGSFGGSADLTWDDTAKELGVGGDINLDDGGSYETTVQVVTPTANRTISFPDATGTVALVAGSTGQVTYNNAGAQAGLPSASIGSTGEINISLAGAASTPPVSFTGTWFTGGTSTTTKPQLLIEPTGTSSTAWSTSGTGLGVNAASGFAGNLLDLQVNGSSKFNVTTAGQLKTTSGQGDIETGLSPAASDFRVNVNGLFVIKYGNTYLSNNLSNGYRQWLFQPGTGFVLNSSAYFGWSDQNFNLSGSNYDITLYRDAAGTLAQRNGANAQTFRVYNTFTDASNYERGFLKWNSGVFEIGTEGAGTGSEQPVRITAATLNIPNLPTYADDAAAGTGGLAAGDVYKTSTGELRIKL